MFLKKKIQKYFKEFVGISSANAYKTSLFYLDNKRVQRTCCIAKCNCCYYESELSFRTFIFIFLKDEQKLGVRYVRSIFYGI